MSAWTFLRLAVPRKAITRVPLGIHPTAHCTPDSHNRSEAADAAASAEAAAPEDGAPAAKGPAPMED